MKRLFTIILLAALTPAFGQNSTKEDSPVKTVRKIFTEYIKYSESTDSRDNKDAMEKALRSLQTKSEAKDLPLLINVWMYYDPTDFFTRDLITPIFTNDKEAALKAIDKRLKKKKKWESEDDAPYTDLVWLKEDLSK